MVDVMHQVDYEQSLPKLVVFNSHTKTIDHVTKSQLAMRVANFTTINTNRTLKSCALDYLSQNEATKSKDEENRKHQSAGRDVPLFMGSSESDGQNTQSFPTTTTVSTPLIVSSACSSTTPEISVRASSTVATMVTTTRTSTQCQCHGEVTCSNWGPIYNSTSVTYCYFDPTARMTKTKANKLPYKVVGSRYLDEKKFVRFIWRRIKDLDFPLALAEIIEQLRRVDEKGIGVCRDRLLKQLKIMIQSKRSKGNNSASTLNSPCSSFFGSKQDDAMESPSSDGIQEEEQV